MGGKSIKKIINGGQINLIFQSKPTYQDNPWLEKYPLR